MIPGDSISLISNSDEALDDGVAVVLQDKDLEEGNIGVGGKTRFLSRLVLRSIIPVFHMIWYYYRLFFVHFSDYQAVAAFPKT